MAPATLPNYNCWSFYWSWYSNRCSGRKL